MKTNIMKTIEIDGKSYLIDIEKAKEQGLLKEKNNKPRSWEEFVKLHYSEDIVRGFSATAFDYRQNPLYNRFNTANEAKAFCALGKLIQLRDAWLGDWKPDWSEDKAKYYIHIYDNKICIGGYSNYWQQTFAFPTKEMANDFLETFRNLIEEAKMFL